MLIVNSVMDLDKLRRDKSGAHKMTVNSEKHIKTLFIVHLVCKEDDSFDTLREAR